MATAVRLYLTLHAAGLRSDLQYRANFLIWLVTGLVYQLTGFLFIWVVLARFEAIAGWTLPEVAFLYSIRLLGHATGLLIFGRIHDLEGLVRYADFDRFLVRPVAPLVQVMTRWFPAAALGDFAGGLALFVAAARIAPVAWSLPAAVFVALAVVGAALLEVGVKLAMVSLSFRFLTARRAVGVVDDAFSTFGNYPTRIFGALEYLLTFALPVAFVGYLPASVLLSRTGELSVHPALAYAAPLVGGLVFLGALRFWRSEMRHYQSSGH